MSNFLQVKTPILLRSTDPELEEQMRGVKQVMQEKGLFNITRYKIPECRDIRPLTGMIEFLGEDTAMLSCDDLAGMLSRGQAGGSALFGSGKSQDDVVNMALESDRMKGLLGLIPFDHLGIPGHLQDRTKRHVVDSVVGECIHFCGQGARNHRE